MGKDTTGVIVEAKAEYTKQLINIIKPVIYREIMKAYKEAEQIGTENILINFQKKFKKNPQME